MYVLALVIDIVYV